MVGLELVDHINVFASTRFGIKAFELNGRIVTRPTDQKVGSDAPRWVDHLLRNAVKVAHIAGPQHFRPQVVRLGKFGTPDKNFSIGVPSKRPDVCVEQISIRNHVVVKQQYSISGRVVVSSVARVAGTMIGAVMNDIDKVVAGLLQLLVIETTSERLYVGYMRHQRIVDDHPKLDVSLDRRSKP